MKKKMALPLVLLMVLSMVSGCTGTQNDTAAEPQELRFEECGFAYTIPQEWTTMENVNLIPTSYMAYDSEIYAKVEYSYTPDENMALLNDAESTVPVEELMTPLVSLIVVRDEHTDSPAVEEALAQYTLVEELEEQEGFHFYLLRDYADDISHFSEEAQETYISLMDTLAAFKDSIKTFPPDEAAAAESAANDGKYLNFLTTTIEGDDIASTVFYDYDLTVVNFWASYCYPDINELAELEAFYQNLKKTHPNVNFLQVVIDTPGESALTITQNAYSEAGVTFTGIMPDQVMASWILNNVEGLPTTIFVSNTAEPLAFKIEGTQTAEYYMENTDHMLKTLADETAE